MRIGNDDQGCCVNELVNLFFRLAVRLILASFKTKGSRCESTGHCIPLKSYLKRIIETIKDSCLVEFNY